MKISIIAAMDEERGIGKDNKIPWHIKEDLIHLRQLIKDNVVILGRKTFDSIVFYYNRSGKEMPARLYIVVTRDKNYTPARPNTTVAHSIEEALTIAKREEKQEVFVLGGEKIFEQMFPMVDRLYLTLVEGRYDADTFFPDYSEFKKVVKRESGEENGLKFEYLDLEK